MALAVGSRLGHYDVTALIGEGGMRSLASLALLPLVVFLSGCSSGVEPEPSTTASSTEESLAAAILGDVLTFHASFDNGVDADWALGDGQIYTAPSYAEQDQAVHGIGNPSVEVADDVGRFGSRRATGTLSSTRPQTTSPMLLRTGAARCRFG